MFKSGSWLFTIFFGIDGLLSRVCTKGPASFSIWPLRQGLPSMRLLRLCRFWTLLSSPNILLAYICGPSISYKSWGKRDKSLIKVLDLFFLYSTPGLRLSKDAVTIVASPFPMST